MEHDAPGEQGHWLQRPTREPYSPFASWGEAPGASEPTGSTGRLLARVSPCEIMRPMMSPWLEPLKMMVVMIMMMPVMIIIDRRTNVVPVGPAPPLGPPLG